MRVTVPYTPGPPGKDNLHIGIVAHIKRAEQAHQLMETVGATYMTMDNGSLGCEGNHLKAWNWLAKKDSTWSVVLEDDCEPVEGFREQLEQALTAAPTPIVGLYLGTSTPTHWQRRIRTVRKHNPDTHFYTTGFHLLNAVGVAIRTHLLPLQVSTQIPIDEAIADWCRTNHHTVAYTNPSLVEHADGPPVITVRYDGQPRTHPRKAWNVGTRQRWATTEAAM